MHFIATIVLKHTISLAIKLKDSNGAQFSRAFYTNTKNGVNFYMKFIIDFSVSITIATARASISSPPPSFGVAE